MNIDTITKHAISPPALDNTKLHRARLVDIIHANLPRKLIAIAAPPGYGKTILLADFTDGSDMPVCWVRLSEADRDLMRMVTLLAASLQRRFRRLRGKIDLQTFAGSSPAAIARMLTAIVDEYVSETFVLILDDVHLINRAAPVLEFLDAWLDVQPEQITLISSGREVLEVSLAKLMAEGDLAGLGPHDLALTRDELEQLLSLHLGMQIPDDEIDRLLEETRGWITGVMLSGMLSQDTINSLLNSSMSMVYDYLASVVLNRQDDAVRRFMLESAVLPVMSVDVCNQALNRDDSSKFLTRLVREGLFISATNDSPRSYEYHPQFRSFLLKTFSDMNPKRLKKLRVQCADYLDATGSPEHAVGLYFEAGAMRQAALHADRNSQAMFRAGRLRTLQDWGEKIEAGQAKAPKVFLYIAKLQTDKGDTASAAVALSKARAMLSPQAPAYLRIGVEAQYGLIAWHRGEYAALAETAARLEEWTPNRSDASTKALVYRIRALSAAHAEKDFDKAEQLAAKAVEILQGGENGYDLAAAMVDLSWMQVAVGNTLFAHATDLKAHEILLEQGAPLPLSSSFNNLAVSAHDQGRYEEALEFFSQGLKFSRQAGSKTRESLILYGQADLFNDLGLALQAAELYGQGLRIAAQGENAGRIQYGCIQTGVLHRRRGSGDLPLQWLKRAMVLSGIKSEDDAPAFLRIQLIALDILNNPILGLNALDALTREEWKTLNPSERTLVHYFQAKGLHLLDQREKAKQAIDDLLVFAAGHGTEQVVAAEMYADPSLWEFTRHRFIGHPAFSTISNRIEMMRAVAQQYQDGTEDGESVPKLSFHTLGTAELYLGAERMDDFKPLTREVFFYLLEHERVERDVLMETFWPQLPPGRQTSNLYTAIYSLRRKLGKDAILLDGSVYEVNPDLDIEYDVSHFERAASIVKGLPQGDPRRFFALTEAINSYGGRFLPEYDTDWVTERRRMLELHFLDILLDHAEECLVRNQPQRAVSSLRQALSIDPYRDDIHMRYLETLGLLDRRSDIVAHYQKYVQMLSTELGLDPPESLRQLYTRLIS